MVIRNPNALRLASMWVAVLLGTFGGMGMADGTTANLS